MNPFSEEDITCVVSKESMVNFCKFKYSLDSKYISCTVEVVLTDNQQRILYCYNEEPIRTLDVTTNQFNFNVANQKSNLLKDHSEDKIKTYISEHSTQYNNLGTELEE